MPPWYEIVNRKRILESKGLMKNKINLFENFKELNRNINTIESHIIQIIFRDNVNPLKNKFKRKWFKFSKRHENQLTNNLRASFFFEKNENIVKLGSEKSFLKFKQSKKNSIEILLSFLKFFLENKTENLP